MKKILGVPLFALLIGGLFVGSAAAVLVAYLSNTATVNLEVTSPFEMSFDPSGERHFDVDIYGGETFSYTVWTRNLADVDLESYPVTIVTSSEVFTGEEFTQVILADPNYPNGIDVTSLMYYVKPDGTLGTMQELASENLNTVKFFFDNNGDGVAQMYARPIGFNEYNRITITTSPAITPGTYTIESCQLYDLTGECV